MAMGPEAVTAEVKASGLRGRGGAGFPTGTKWSFLPKGVFPRYLCVNADESEPGCFKDRYLMEEFPHQFIEGVLISAFALEVSHAFIYVRGEYRAQRELLEKAVAEVYAAGFAGQEILGSDWSCELIVHGGAGAYICGEETALLDSLEGLRGQPRLKPPFPAVKGLYGQPTIVNNVETLSNIPFIVSEGGAKYAAIGTESSPGSRLFCVSGHVERPGNYEVAMGTTSFRELLEMAEELGLMMSKVFSATFKPNVGSFKGLHAHVDAARTVTAGEGDDLLPYLRSCDLLDDQLDNLERLAKPKRSDFGKFGGIIACVTFAPLLALFAIVNKLFSLGVDGALVVWTCTVLALIAGFGYGALKFRPLLPGARLGRKDR
jgi:hypothetical protein